MTEEDKQLLIKDLCARLPYGVKVKVGSNNIRTVRGVDVVEGMVHFVESDSISPFGVHIEHPSTLRQSVKPYLRPMSSMTLEEECEFCRLFECDSVNAMYGYINWVIGGSCDYDDFDIEFSKLAKIIDWLNKYHFDYRELIKKGLALEAPEDMYKSK